MSEIKSDMQAADSATPAQDNSNPTANTGTSEPTTAGNPDPQSGEILPDISPVATIQEQNLKKMNEAVQTASTGLQSILSQQQKTLQQSLDALQKSLAGSQTRAGLGSSPPPSLNVPVENMTRTLDSLNSAATTLTKSMAGSIDSLENSIKKSEAAIKQVEQKFSSAT